MQLSELHHKFQQHGIKVIGITYDDPTDLSKFHNRSDIAFVLAQDPDSQLIKSLGILNTGPKPGDGAYGIPYPGMFLLNADGAVVKKFAEESYKLRPDYNIVLEAAAALAP